MKKFRYILCALTLLVASATAHAQVFNVSITPTDGSEVFSKTNATHIEIEPGAASPIYVFSGNSDKQGSSLTVTHGVRYDFTLTPVTGIKPGSGDLPEGDFPANAKAMTTEGLTTTVEEPSFTEPELTGPALVLMREEGDPIIYYAKDPTEGPIKLKCNAKGEYVIGDKKVQGTVIAVFYKDAHTSTAHPAVEPTSDKDGNIAYWSCAADGCGKYFADEYCTKEIAKNSCVRTMVAGSVIWDDFNNLEDKRPESVTITLLRGGQEQDNVTVKASDNWAYSFTGLPKYNGEQEIVYSISAPEVTGYTAKITGNDVTYTINHIHNYTGKVLSATPDSETGLYDQICENNCGTPKEGVKAIKNYAPNAEGVAKNLYLSVDANGKYSVTEPIALTDGNNLAGVRADITAPSAPTYTRTMTSQWGTLVVPFDVVLIDGQQPFCCYKITSIADGRLTLKKLSGKLRANTPVLVRMNSDVVGQTDNLSLEASNCTLKAVKEVTPVAIGVDDNYSLAGTYDKMEPASSDYFISNNSFWNVGYMLGKYTSAHVFVSPFRAYINSTATSGAKQLVIGAYDDEETTSINNEQLTINIEAGAVYNLNGQRLTAPQKGLNIINGKKILVK